MAKLEEEELPLIQTHHLISDMLLNSAHHVPFCLGCILGWFYNLNSILMKFVTWSHRLLLCLHGLPISILHMFLRGWRLTYVALSSYVLECAPSSVLDSCVCHILFCCGKASIFNWITVFSELWSAIHHVVDAQIIVPSWSTLKNIGCCKNRFVRLHNIKLCQLDHYYKWSIPISLSVD
jgi:hypothetical protein